MAITSARMQMKRGEEFNFDPDKMLPGEWAVSTDTKYVRMCFSPGVCVRMATYEAFEADMAQITAILEEAKTVQEAVEKIYEEFKNAELDIETAKTAAQTATEKAEEASVSADNAYNDSVIAQNKALEASESAEIATAKAIEATEASENSSLKANEASESASEALNSAENAKLSEDKSVENSKLSESYAVGGTGTRTGEDTDNSKYYSDLAKTEADRAKKEADRAENIANVGIATTEKAGLVKPDGETITVDEDGTIHASEGTTDYADLENKPQIEGVELSGNKTLSELGIASADDLSTANENINVNSEKISEVEVKVDTIIEKAELNIKNSASGENIHLTDSANGKNVAFSLYGKAKQDGEPTPDNPIEINVSGSDGSVEVVSCGKNLLKHNAMSQTVNGVTFTANNDGSIKLSGTASADIYYNLFKNRTIDTLKNGNVYTVSGNDNDSCQFFVYNVTQGKGYGKYYNAITEMTVNESDLFNVGIKVLNGSVVNTTIYPMIRLASDTDDTYEPYKETVSTILTPDGLAGIPVKSGGNYTDENGQQWICDEKVKYADGTGKKIQRIGKYTFTGKESGKLVDNNLNIAVIFPDDINIPTVNDKHVLVNALATDRIVTTQAKTIKNYIGFAHWTEKYAYFSVYEFATVTELQTYLANGNTTVYYELAEPIITDLSAEEIAEIEKLHTFYPITNISNDAECGMKVTYIADSKNYIDGQLAIQKAQQEEALATMLLLMPEEVQASMIENDTNNLLNESEV